MEAYTEYWAATLIRGLLAVVAGTAVVFMAAVASTVVLFPFALVLATLLLAAYVTIDSALVLTTGFMVPRGRPGRFALRLQGLGGAAIGVLLFSLAYKRSDIHWFLYLLAIQAAGTAVTEFIVARGITAQRDGKWFYAGSAIAAASTIFLLWGRNSEPRVLAWLIYSYLGFFGFNLLALSAHMLFTERKLLRSAHP